jgi:chromosome segregation ATPase
MENNNELIAVTKQRNELENKLEKSKSYKNVMKRDNARLRKQLTAVTEQRDRLAVAARTLPDYDAGLLNDFGGGDAGWWQDYIRAEIGRANEYWRAALAAVEGGSHEH